MNSFALASTCFFTGWLCLASVAGCLGHDPAKAPEAPDGSVQDQGVSLPDAETDAAVHVDGSVKRDTSPARDAAATAVFMSVCPKSDLLFCENFESGGLDTKVWKWSPYSASYVLDTERVFSGKYSLKINVSEKSKSPWNFGVIKTIQAYQLAGRDLYVRALVFIEPQVPSRHFWVMLATNAAPKPAWDYALNLVPERGGVGAPILWRYLWHYGTASASHVGQKDRVPRVGEWACWEWELLGSKNELRLSVNGEPVMGMTAGENVAPGNKGKWLAPPQAQFSFGFRTSHVESLPVGGSNIWLDEIAIDDAKIGCMP
jgi:hypothetical protein